MLIWVTLATSLASAATVDLAVVVDRTIPDDAVTLEARATWLGAAVSTPLTDAHGVRGDGLWSGQLQGASVRMLPLSLVLVGSDGSETLLAQSTEQLDAEHSTITWSLEGDPRTSAPRARRVALAWSARQLERFETASTAAGFGWMALVFGYVAWWLRDRSDGTRRRRRGRG